MARLDDLRRLEEGFWHATRDAGYYQDHMRDDGLAVFAGSIMTKDEAARSTQAEEAAAWKDVRVGDARLIEIAADVAAFVYEGSATRDGSPYRATCSTVYARRDGEWQLVLHQQSAIDVPGMVT
jgi:ketosteroid isomerase-like protein